ncbi:MAG: riboflavin synthase [Candidatus Krumholzibacteria bacterium]|nr:riboflavin synthase [Candidatus Krumholzibacteria bacterium]
MFTGLIKEVGKLRSMASRGGVTRLDIEAPATAGTAGVGDSISVSGICLTVTALAGRLFSVEAASETRRLTTLKQWRRGDRLHLEPALRVGDPLDGHYVQGHVDGTGTVSKIRKAGGSLLVTVDLPRELAAYLTPKGSVAVDGVSLTVDEGPFDRGFTVNLIPHTLAATTFADLRTGRRVNLEMDVLVKAARGAGAVRQDPQSPLTVDRVLARGFGRRRPPRTG